MISRAINYEKIRPYALVLLTALLAFFAGEGIFKVMAERTLGSILRHNIATITVMFILFAFYNENFIPAIFNLKKIDLPSIKQAAPLVIFAAVSGIAIFVYGGFGIIYCGIILFILLTLGFSVFYIFTGKPFNALCFFWCAYPFIYFIQSEVEKLDFKKPMFDDLVIPFSAAYILILFVSIILANVKKDFLRGKPVQFVYWLILLSIPSTFFSANPLKSSVFFFFDMIVSAMFFIIVMTAVQEKADIERLAKVMIFSLTTLIVITFYFYRSGENQQNVLDLYEATNVIISPALLACLAAMMLPFSILFFGLNRNKVYMVLSLVFIVLIILSDARSAFIGLFITISLLFVLSKTVAVKKLFYLTAVFTGVATPLFIINYFDINPEIQHRVVTTIQQLQEGVSLNEISSGRTEIWDSAVRMIKNHPVMGIGAGMWQDNAHLYNSRLYEFNRPGYGYSSYCSVDAHNFFLDTYLKYGVFTLLLFLWFIFRILRQSFQMNRKRAIHKHAINTAGFISILIWTVFAITSYRFYYYQSGSLILGFFFWSLTGIIFKLAEFNENRVG